MDVFEIAKLQAGLTTDALIADALGTRAEWDSEYPDGAAYSSNIHEAFGIIAQTKGRAVDWPSYEGIEWKLWWWPERETWIVDAYTYGRHGGRMSDKSLALAVCKAFLLVHSQQPQACMVR